MLTTGFNLLHLSLPEWFPLCLFWLSLLSSQRRQWHPTPVLLPRKSHGQRSLVGCSPWGHEESDMTERLHFHFSLSCIGERNGNPLQCSCLENPREGRTRWAAVYGVPQSQTQLKWLSSSSSIGITGILSDLILIKYLKYSLAYLRYLISINWVAFWKEKESLVAISLAWATKQEGKH